MKKNEIVVGGTYTAKVSGKLTVVRVDAIRATMVSAKREGTVYDVTNIRTGRRTMFRSAAKLREVARGKAVD